MDVRSLRYAVTLASELHFGRAARAHFIAAQPFGRRIQQLEREVGAPLFARSSRRVELTPAGERFLPRARRVLAQLDALVADVEGSPADTNTLRIGVVGFGLADLWPAVRDLVLERRPGLELVPVELDWQNQYDAVRAGDVDVAIIHDVGGGEDLLVEHALLLDRWAVVPVDSELADARYLTEADVDGYRWISPVGDEPGLAAFGDPGAGVRVRVRSPTGIPLAVATSGRLGVHGEAARRFFPHPGVRYVPMEGLPSAAAIASQPRDRREVVALFRAATHAVVASRAFPLDEDGTAPGVRSP